MNKNIEILITMIEYLGKFKSGINDICNYIEMENEIKACEIIVDATEGLQWIIDATVLSRDIHKGSVSTQNLESILSDIVDALENQDYILVGDLFNYEILPNIIEIEKSVKEVLNV